MVPAVPNVNRTCRRQAHVAPVNRACRLLGQWQRFIEMGEKEWIRRERITLWGSNSTTRDSSRFTPGRYPPKRMRSRVCQIFSPRANPRERDIPARVSPVSTKPSQVRPEYNENHIGLPEGSQDNCGSQSDDEGSQRGCEGQQNCHETAPGRCQASPGLLS